MHAFSLTSDAKLLLARGSRTVAPATISDVTSVLCDANFPLFLPVAATFFHFGGTTFPIGSDFAFSIFTVNQAVESLVCVKSDDPDEFRIEFGQHSIAPLGFAMNGHGTIYADDGPVSHGVEKWFEHHAMLASVEKWDDCCRVNLQDQPDGRFEAWANSRFQLVTHASDEYSQWWRTSSFALNRFVGWAQTPMMHERYGCSLRDQLQKSSLRM